MNISLFLKGKEFHITCGKIENIYVENETSNLADNVPLFISDIISKTDINNLENLVYSSGPSSFTSIRIINSIVKAFAISFPKVKFLGLSHFLTYLYVLNDAYSRGVIAIPTMRGDYFTTLFNNKKLNNINIEKIPFKYSQLNDPVIFESSNILPNINMAKAQLLLLNTDFVAFNPRFINTALSINYGFTPEYSY